MALFAWRLAKARQAVSADFLMAAQLEIAGETAARLGLDAYLQSIQAAARVASLDLLAVGGDEIPQVFHALTGHAPRIARQVFIWYPLLADYPGWAASHRMLNYRGAPTQGLGDAATQESLGEKFQFSCPNNPDVRAVTRSNLQRILRDYAFDGVFLDKIRYPSPANGLAEMMTCFCPYCREKARRQNLDLDLVRHLLENFPWHSSSALEDIREFLRGAAGLTERTGSVSVFERFLRFRADSITDLVAEIADVVGKSGKILALDLFSPALAMLVGQDYAALAKVAAWCKPMVYRFARGPSGLRLEIPRLVEEIAAYSGAAIEKVWQAARDYLPSMADAGPQRLSLEGAPYELIASETSAAVRRFAPRPVYLGVEAVSLDAFQIHIAPDHLQKTVRLAWQAGAKGVVLSWDLLGMPAENLRAAHQAVTALPSG